MNTYGLFSVNHNSFNVGMYPEKTYPQAMRDVAVAALKVHNLVLDILGYIPGISQLSGCVRMSTGLMLCVTTLAMGEGKSYLSSRLYKEALMTGMTQIVRGAFEALFPCGKMVNAVLDGSATIWNTIRSIKLPTSHNGDTVSYGFGYPNPRLAFPLNIA